LFPACADKIALHCTDPEHPEQVENEIQQAVDDKGCKPYAVVKTVKGISAEDSEAKLSLSFLR